MPTDIKTLVIKIGTSLLSGDQGFDGRYLESIVKEIADLKREQGINVLLVSSGAVGCGMDVLGIKERPQSLPQKQATAAVGQSRLMHYYETLFNAYGKGLNSAQVLLSAADLDDRQTYLNLRNTVHSLFEMKTVVPVVNENDSVAIDELKFGDNDTLAARVASKIDADLLIILSDVDGLYDKNPHKHPDAQLVRNVPDVDDELLAAADGTGTETTVGGMRTKLEAARIGAASGLPVVIANGKREGVIHSVLNSEGAYTLFEPADAALSPRKRWIAFGRAARGALQVDTGARAALLEQGKSLLAAGITEVQGDFEQGAAVRILDPDGHDIACGLVNYASAEIQRVQGCKSSEIQGILGRKDFDEIIHRDNLVLL
jgi:glutamate 5-kinase